MNTKSKVLVLITSALIVGLTMCSLLLYAASQRRKVFDKYEMANEKFRIRVTAYHEHVPFTLPGARYVFQSAPIGSENWNEILTVSVDDAIPIPRDQSSFVLDHVGYMFFSNYYMVTIDSGRTWSVWDANKDLPVEHKQYNLWPAVKKVKMRADGVGTMTLYQWISKEDKGPDLVTSDYGEHWTIDH